MRIFPLARRATNGWDSTPSDRTPRSSASTKTVPLPANGSRTWTNPLVWAERITFLTQRAENPAEYRNQRWTGKTILSTKVEDFAVECSKSSSPNNVSCRRFWVLPLIHSPMKAFAFIKAWRATTTIKGFYYIRNAACSQLPSVQKYTIKDTPRRRPVTGPPTVVSLAPGAGIGKLIVDSIVETAAPARYSTDFASLKWLYLPRTPMQTRGSILVPLGGGRPRSGLGGSNP